MNNFPGIVLHIDEDLTLLDTYQNTNSIENDKNIGNEAEKIIIRNNFVKLTEVTNYFLDKGIPLFRHSDLSITSTKILINKLKNVRLLILDLDLDGDGSVSENDINNIEIIIEESIKKYGYFFLLIYSNHDDNWNDVKAILLKNTNISSLINHFSSCIQKSNAISDQINLLIKENLSINLIYNFETGLNAARDKAFHDFIDFDKNTWQYFITSIAMESGSIVNLEISNILLNLLRQYLVDNKYDLTEKSNIDLDSDLLKKIYIAINYLKNKNSALANQPIWTGNFYRTKKKDTQKEYALIITPECDIAQNKFYKFKVLYGIEINSKTFVNYNKDDKYSCIIAERFPKKKDKWKEYSKIKDAIEKNELPESLFLLPFSTESEKSILLDFRTTECFYEEQITENEWELLFRINDNLMTDILDKYSNYYNRKGQISFPFDKMKLI